MTVTTFQPSTEDMQANATFEAMMWAMARPGTIQHLVSEKLEALATTILDTETQFFASDPVLMEAILATRARPAPVDQADYLFVSLGTEADVRKVAAAHRGTFLYPDSSATLIAPARFGKGQGLALVGPGIDGRVDIRIDGIDAVFWKERANSAYPLGWDVYLTDGARLMGIPRSTAIEVL